MGNKIRGVIFDNDNTIAKIYPDPKGYWLDVFLATVKECGGKVPEGREEEYMLAYYTGRNFVGRLKELGVTSGWDEFQAAKGRVDERLRISLIKAGKSYLFPDAIELIKYLDRNGIKFGVATFTSRPVVMAAFDQLPEVPRPQGFFGWDDSLEKKLEKPNPEIAYLVLDQMGVKPEESIMVGDRLTDVELGNQAGMKSCLVKRAEEDGDLIRSMEREIEAIRGNLGRVEDFKQIPTYQVTSLTELLPIIESS